MNSLVLKKSAGYAFGYSIVVILTMAVPYIFHLLNLPGTLFLPLYTGIVTAVFVTASPVVLAAALTAPLLNFLATGMPPIAPLPIMQFLTLELVAVALAGYWLNNKNIPLIIKLLAVVLTGRTATVILLPFTTYSIVSWWLNGILGSWPGIVFNVAVPYLLLRFYHADK